MSKFTVWQQPVMFGVSHYSTSYHVGLLITILLNYIPSCLVDFIVECMDLRIMMNILIMNSEILSNDDEIDNYAHPACM